MAGSDPTGAFNATLFRSSIRQAMTMGMPGATSQQVTFIYDEKATYTVEDPRNLPYDWTEATHTDVAQRSLIVPVAVSWAVGAVTADEMGQFDTSRGVLTLLDEDYAKVVVGGVFPDEVAINGIHYVIEAWAPPMGLFDATIYQLTIAARG